MRAERRRENPRTATVKLQSVKEGNRVESGERIEIETQQRMRTASTERRRLTGAGDWH